MRGESGEVGRGTGGFGSIEAMVALALLAAIAAAFSSAMAHARRLHIAVAAERRAAQAALSALERLRAGGAPRSERCDGFAVTSSLAPWMGSDRLLEARVEVEWHDGQPRSLLLRTLLVR